MMKTLYLIGGTMGVGKTTVCLQMKQQVSNSVFLDGDWCWDSHPFQVTEETSAMVLDNICHLLNNFLRCSAYENVIFCWVMHEKSIWDEILRRLDTRGCMVRCISLTAEEAALRFRLERDIRAGIRQPDITERSIARLALYPDLGTTVIDTTDLTVDRIVQKIIDI